MYAGVIAVPAYPPRRHRHDPRLQAILNDAQATVALTTQDILSGIEASFVHTADLKRLHWVATDRLQLDCLAEGWHLPHITPHSLAYLQYTSGSTASPKGVMVSHANVLDNVRMMQKASSHSKESVLFGWLPLFHDLGLVGHVLYPLYVGCQSILMSSVDFIQKPFRWLQGISSYRANGTSAPNFAYDLCVRLITDEQKKDLDLSCLEMALVGAEPVDYKTLEQFAMTFVPCGFRDQAFYPCYGLAEATLSVSGNEGCTPLQVLSVQEKAYKFLVNVPELL